MFNDIKDVDKYFSTGFMDFVLLYKPLTLNDFYDKLESFSKIQDKQFQMIYDQDNQEEKKQSGEFIDFKLHQQATG